MHRILACVVTYNRKELLIRNIDSLLKQKYPCDILILDNKSTDGTYEYLKGKNYFNNKNIYYVCSDKNSGGSGGFYQCCEYGLNHDYDYLWLMDDDGYCLNEETLSVLVNNIKDDKTILNSLVLQNEDTLTFSLHGTNKKSEIISLSNNGILDDEANPFNGTLVPINIIKTIGGVNKDFFIYGDETEFMLRTKKYGFNYKTVVNSLYYHPVNNPEIIKVKFLGYKADVIKLPNWKLYCFVRNYSCINLNYFSNKQAKLFGYSMLIQYFLAKQYNQLKVIKTAIRDAKNGVYDKDITLMMRKDYKW